MSGPTIPLVPPPARPPVLPPGDPRAWRAKAFALLPVVAVLGVTGALLVPTTRGPADWMLRENRPVELLTFVFLAVGGWQCLRLARRSPPGTSRVVTAMRVVLALGMLVVAMEEIAWGQQFFGFETPAGLAAINRQGETTLHNIGPLQGRSELFRLAFGLAGLLAIGCRRARWLSGLAPAATLAPWFLVISAHAGVDVLFDAVSVPYALDRAVARGSELIELLIAVTAWLYVRDVARTTPAPSAG